MLPCRAQRQLHLFMRVWKMAKNDYQLRHVCLPVHPSVPMEQPGSRWMDFHEIWQSILLKISRDNSILMIYLLTAIGLPPGGRRTMHIDTQTIYRTIQNEQYVEQHNNFGRVRAVPRLGAFSSQCDKNNWYFTWRRMHICYNVSLNSS